MPKRIEAATDIATIGIWDPEHERHDLKRAKHEDYKSGLRAEANAGRLFFLDTGRDGSFRIDLYLDESPGPDDVKNHARLERDFLIRSQSGRLLAGGLEDFNQPDRQITFEEDEFSLDPGCYALTVYRQDEEILDENLKRLVESDDLEYYKQRVPRFPWGGCALFIAGMVTLLLGFWIVGLGILAVMGVHMFVRDRILAADTRYQKVHQRIEEYTAPIPELIFVLRSLPEATDLQGGWHDPDAFYSEDEP